MSGLDGVKTASGFEHSLRPALKRAKELKEMKAKGKEFKPVPAGAPRKGAGATATVCSSKKRGNKSTYST